MNIRTYAALALAYLLPVPALAASPGAPALGEAPAPAARLPPALVTFYRTALPQAATFVRRTIPQDMLSPADKDNATYLEVYDAQRVLLGYLRDFVGPVSPAESCPCNPLNLTLVLAPDKTLRTIIAAAPLQKWGHEVMTAEEQARLIALVKKPAPELMQVRRVEDVVDATTGATRQGLAGMVVPRAGLSTRRIAGLVRDTRDILQGAPAGRDRQRLHAILASPDEADVARQLAILMPELESAELRPQVYRLLANAYLAALQAGKGPQPAVEERLLRAGLPADMAGGELASVGYRLADKGLRLPFVQKCVAALSGPNAIAAAPEALAALQGTARFASGDRRGAFAYLRQAAGRLTVETMPELHARLAQAALAAGDQAAACSTARALFAGAPLFAGSKEALTSCARGALTADQVGQEVRAQNRAALLRQERAQGAQVPAVLSMEDAQGQPVEVHLRDPARITVAVFFATWCPHCRMELPRIKAFLAGLASRPELADRVRVIGVRTAVEKESEPYPDFAKQFGLGFPVYSDATMSLAFAQFAKSQGIPAALPTTAVIDEQGIVRYFLEPGDWRDTATEILWATEALVPKIKKPPAG